jgi:peptidylprolyl isomerase domain and WD repeat-containing protein 1
MTRKYDESMTAIQEMQQAGTAIYKVDDMEFGRRLAVERELEKDERVGRTTNCVWDESGNFLIYPTMLGIKGTPEIQMAWTQWKIMTLDCFL